ncbi:hemerythrin domain-containing protein [Alicyclobacillus sp. ALC3]|uniref:hemerythrin domain-containing protein n=1 Tax=Alicyclobacillus sp. ALC3 TaxID=2796143 RepID=UPI00237907FE|nr:hemerythrin domain-containing protein [Alicyclobacillus sp. ALC3]WDL97555.1 hemerythrin domain-containing protein [Alicyclobacillus sp. ALC3]
MSGPALKQGNAHEAIHNAALFEADELTTVVRQLHAEQMLDKAKAAAQLVVEHWQTRTLRHATEEEEGLYSEILAANSERAVDIAALTHDHDLMRKLVSEAETYLTSDELKLALARFDMLLWLVEAHSREEERLIFATRPTEGASK